MALDFPLNPTDGQAYNGYVYSTSVGAWQAKPSAQSPFYTADTPPTNPVKGDSWFNTNDGTMYIYTYDGNSYQWVEHRSQIAKSQVGLVPVVPSTISISAGTATANYLGTITYTAATSVLLNNVFSSAYKNYRIIVSCAASTGCEIAARFSTDGTPNSSASYKAGGWRYASSVTDNYSMGSGSYWPLGLIASSQTNNFTASYDIYNPTITGDTNYVGQSVGFGGTYSIALSYGGQFHADTNFNGLYLYPTAGNFTGTVTVYGYN